MPHKLQNVIVGDNDAVLDDRLLFPELESLNIPLLGGRLSITLNGLKTMIRPDRSFYADFDAPYKMTQHDLMELVMVSRQFLLFQP